MKDKEKQEWSTVNGDFTEIENMFGNLKQVLETMKNDITDRKKQLERLVKK